MRLLVLTALSLVASAPLAAQHDHDAHHGKKPAKDSSFAKMQERGRQAMGVDQYTSVHVFDALADGGRIELQRPEADSVEVEVIRTHLRDIAERFGNGDFAIPGFVHDGEVPGTRTLAERRERVAYRMRPLPKGGEVRITTTDPAALAAIREFMAFQRTEHRSAGKH